MEQIFKLGIPYLLVLVIPGYIYTATRQFMIGSVIKPVDTGEAIRIVIRSAIINAMTALFLILMGHGNHEASAAFFQTVGQPLSSGNTAVLIGSEHQAWHAFLAFMILPGVYGGIIGTVRRAGYSVEDVLRRRFKNLAQTSDQAIDQAIFVSLNICKKCSKELILGVKTKDGMVYGRFGAQSMLSKSGGYRDLYLEEAWEEGSDGDLVKASNPSSILIKGSVIEALIFFYV